MDDKSWEKYHIPVNGKQVISCTVPDNNKPMIYRNQPFCSDKCRKLQGQGPKEGYRGRTA